MIGLGTALGAFAVLAAVSLLFLKGRVLYVVLILIGALALKAYVHHLRGKAG
jgi:hypothetical protein